MTYHEILDSEIRQIFRHRSICPLDLLDPDNLDLPDAFSGRTRLDSGSVGSSIYFGSFPVRSFARVWARSYGTAVWDFDKGYHPLPDRRYCQFRRNAGKARAGITGWSGGAHGQFGNFCCPLGLPNVYRSDPGSIGNGCLT